MADPRPVPLGAAPDPLRGEPSALPAGTVAFLFADVAGITARWERDPAGAAADLARYERLLRDAVAAQGGTVFKTVGDGVCAAFPTAAGALAAAVEAQRGLAGEEWGKAGPLRARMALHAGAATPDADGEYRGPTLNRVARLLAAAHGGQALVSHAAAGLTRDALPPGVVLRDLGEHRLRDLPRAERVFQVEIAELPADFPPLRAETGGGAELPHPRASLVGREEEVAAVSALLLDEATPLVTLTGPGGVGKTSLALQLAADLGPDFLDGVALVDLSPLRDPELVMPAIAQALGVRDSAGRTLSATLVDALRGRRLLLVLDNVEQVVDFAPDIVPLLSACPRLTVLATGRTALRVSVEREYPVPPLALPDPRRRLSAAAIAATPAVALFVERARAVTPSFSLTDVNAAAVAEICRRLDGLPLAIELAAARVKILSPQALLARLTNRLQVLTAGARDRPERLRTMRATVEWSHDLLDGPERALFRRLAVFAGGFSLEAAEAVVAEAGDRPEGTRLDVLDGVAALVDNSLLRRTEEAQGQPRFAMLETIREYGLERLADGGEAAATRGAHAAFYLTLAEQAAPELTGPRQGEWLDRLEAEHDNLRAALAWTLERGGGEAALRLAGALGRFWRVRGYLAEGAAWLERVLTAGTTAPANSRVKGLIAAGVLARVRGDAEGAARLLEEGAALARALGDDGLLADALIELGAVEHLANDDVVRREALFTEALELYRRVGDRLGIDRCQVNLGEVARGRGDFALAAARYEESLAVVRKLGDRNGLFITLVDLGAATRALGDLDRAAALYREALAIQRELGNLEHLVYSLNGLAGLALDRGRPERATRLLGAAAALAEVTGVVVERVDREQVDRDVAAARARLGEAAFAVGWEDGRALPLDDALAEALAAAASPAAASPAAPPAEASPGRPAAPHGLTERELDVLRLLVAGRTDREIAEALFIGRRTAEGHVANICAKLGVRTRTAAATAAVAAGLVAPGAD